MFAVIYVSEEMASEEEVQWGCPSQSSDPTEILYNDPKGTKSENISLQSNETMVSLISRKEELAYS